MRIIDIKLILIEKDGDHPEGMSVGDSLNIIVDESRPIYIGRAPAVDVLVNAPSVGRKVAVLRLETDGVVVEDLGSGGGSAMEVNGVRTQRPSCLLANNAVLWIGRVGFRVEVSGEG